LLLIVFPSYMYATCTTPCKRCPDGKKCHFLGLRPTFHIQQLGLCLLCIIHIFVVRRQSSPKGSNMAIFDE
jgi:hypothetical protein